MRNKKAVPPKILRNGKEEFPTSEMEENAGKNVLQPKSAVQKDDLEKARDELVEEIARSVCESSDSGEEKGMALEDLVSSLRFNPFVTRKQIPQTPENLLTEIRSSWRKALQPEGSLDLELSAAEVVTEESSVNAVPGVQEEVDSTSVCSEDGSPVSDLGPPVAEKKSQFISTESSSQEQTRTVELEAGHKGTFIRMGFVKQQRNRSSAFLVPLSMQHLLQALSGLGSCTPFDGDCSSFLI
ncbi:HAUS augmin-like complex subunit 6 [Oenanthe melanoleuca]|uniref:HAUS augmin-like complex subunit 6 n=1 Tax=Oenanthe melanoleuca TaxID=2939378 RepID=UPI0024C20C3B|nr:HAUS augmin-like complex subunit 6 [Oenanthe melanoleuca]